MALTCKKQILFWLMLIAAAPSACAGRAEYRVEIEAPPDIEETLSERLEIFRWKKDPALDSPFFRSLYSGTPREIKTILRESGYFAPDIKSELDIENEIYTAFFKVDPGETASVRSVELSFKGEIMETPYECAPGPEQIKDEWLLPEGAAFGRRRWDTAKRRMLRMFLTGCYPAAEITRSEAVVHPLEGAADLYVEIDSGPAFTLGELSIEGLERYPEELVHNLNFIREGSPHSREKLTDLQNRLQNSGYFEYVDARIDPDPDFHENAPVLVTLSEKKRKEIRMGIELSSDTGAGARFEYRDINLRRRGLKLRNVLQANRAEHLFLSNLEMPTMPNGTFDNYDFTASRSDIRKEELNLLRFGFSRTRPMGTFLRVFRLQYSRETRRLPEDERVSARSLNPVVSWNARETDHLLYPTRGYLLNIRTAGALDGVFSDSGFLHANARGKSFHSPGRKNLIIAGGEAGYVAAGSRAGIPSEFLFRTGGADTIRGYSYRSIGVVEGGAVVGGRYMFTGSLEYNRAVGDRWSAAVFIDGGSAYDDFDNFEPVFGYGAGLRLKTPAGPVNFDIAYGEELKQYKFHFTMGVVF